MAIIRTITKFAAGLLQMNSRAGEVKIVQRYDHSRAEPVCDLNEIWREAHQMIDVDHVRHRFHDDHSK